MQNRFGRAVLLAAGSVMVFAADAQAQPAPPAETAPNASTHSGEIVVTAQRREQRLQDVPIAVDAVSAQVLADSGVSTLQNISLVSSSVQASTVRNRATPFIRGVGTQNTSIGEEGSVATYLDGVFVPALSASTFNMNNVERVEILKGPQGTLFGRNATGGAINVITRDPSHTPFAQANVSYADYAWVQGSLYATTSLTHDIAIDTALYIQDQGKGFGNQLNIGGSPLRGLEVNARHEHMLRTKLRWDLGSDTNIVLSLDAGRYETDIGNARSILPGTLLVGGIPPTGGAYDTLSGDKNDSSSTYRGYSVKVEHDFGWARLTNITAGRDYRELVTLDQDSQQTRFVYLTLPSYIYSFQQELILNGDVQNLNWTVGAIYYSGVGAYYGYQLQSTTTPSLNYTINNKTTTESLALYAQAEFEILSDTHITAGGRITQDDKQIVGNQIATIGNSVPVGTPVGPGPVDRKASFEQPTWRVSLDHRFSENLMAYASQSRGYKSGTFTIDNYGQPVVKPEILDATEVGLKMNWFDGRLVFDVSAFQYRYRNIQLQVSTSPGQVLLFNAAAADPSGIDGKLTVNPPTPTGNLQITAGFSSLDAFYKSFPNATVTTPRPTGGGISSVIDASGKRMVRAPELSTDLGVDYSVPFGAGEVSFNAVWAHSSGFFIDSANRLEQPAYDVFNARIAYDFGKTGVYLYANNLSDERYLLAVSSSSLGFSPTYADPRVIGVGVKYMFGL